MYIYSYMNINVNTNRNMNINMSMYKVVRAVYSVCPYLAISMARITQPYKRGEPGKEGRGRRG
jgi:hypothetical protein